jgi:hypothetical protein
MKIFLELLEKFSAYLEKISKPMERKMAYVFCIMQIVVCLISVAAAVGFFVYNFQKQTAFEMRMVLLVFLLVMLFILGSYTHMLITRDLRHIRGKDPEKKEDTAKKRKIEF